MKVGVYNYKGLEYKMELTSGDDRLKHKNHFYATSGSYSTDYYKTFDEADLEMKSYINNFIDNVPRDVDGIVSKLADLLVWTGYEDCELDTVAAKVLITNYIKHREIK